MMIEDYPTPAHHPAITPAGFKSHFKDIAVHFNWQRFQNEQWPIEHFTTDDANLVSRFHTFFRYSFGRINGHFLHWAAMRQMRIEEVLLKLSRVPEPDRSSITYFSQEFAAQPGIVHLDVPTFALPGGGQYILDCNHRLCGLIVSGKRFELNVFSVHGPLSKDAANDTMYCRENS